MRPADLPDTLDLAFDKTALFDDEAHEPLAIVALTPAMTAEIIRLDPCRIELGPDPVPPKGGIWRGPIGSLLLHLLPALMLVAWLRPPLAVPPPIPIQLVVEPPPLPPPQPAPATPKPKAEVKPPPGPRASEDSGAVGPPKPEKGSDTEPPTQGAPAPPAPIPDVKPADASPEPPPAPTQVAAALPPPPPAPPKPAPPKKEAAIHLPKPDGMTLPLPIFADRPHAASRSGKVPGPNASRDEYCAYALSLIQQHLNLLPAAFVGARHSDTEVEFTLRADGSITDVRVVRGSTYQDIDEKVAQMVWAVGRFPTLPAWTPGSQRFIFHAHFPNSVVR